MENKQENFTEEYSTLIPTEIMGDYEYSNKSRIRPPNKLWAEHGYKLKFFVPTLLFILLYTAMFYLEVIG